MPNTTIYMDNILYYGFLQLEDETRKKLRSDFVDSVRDELKEGDKT